MVVFVDFVDIIKDCFTFHYYYHYQCYVCAFIR